MASSAKDVMDLRNKTGLGMMECKAALEETGGDVTKAVELLRKKGLAKMDGRTDRATAEGRATAIVSPDRTKGVVVEVNTETDFVAKHENFAAMLKKMAEESIKQPAGAVAKTDVMQSEIDQLRLTTKENIQFGRGKVLGGQADRVVGSYVHFTGKIAVIVELEATDPASVSSELLSDICMHIAAVSPIPLGVVEADVPAEIIEKEKQIAKAQAIEQGKPENIAEKMVTGKIRKFYEDHCLNLQLFIKDDKKRIHEILPKGAKILSFVRYQVGMA